MSTESDIFSINCLTVIGPGLLGTSVALGLKARGFQGKIVGVGRSAGTLDAARATGAYDGLTLEGDDAIAQASLIIVAVPLGAFERVFAQIARSAKPDVIVTDVGSTKSSVIDAARKSMPDLRRVIGSHPMAGSEHAGPSAAEADIFVGKPCVMTVNPTDDAQAVAQVAGLWRTLGMRLIEMTPEEHDRQVAVISHLPHLMSVMLMRLANKQGGLDIASTGFAGMARLAASNPAMRADIIESNRENLCNVLDQLRIACEEIGGMIAAGDQNAIQQMLVTAAKAHDQWRG